jgi:hypothetical protein
MESLDRTRFPTFHSRDQQFPCTRYPRGRSNGFWTLFRRGKIRCTVEPEVGCGAGDDPLRFLLFKPQSALLSALEGSKPDHSIGLVGVMSQEVGRV